jgi:hypothetical protein
VQPLRIQKASAGPSPFRNRIPANVLTAIMVATTIDKRPSLFRNQPPRRGTMFDGTGDGAKRHGVVWSVFGKPCHDNPLKGSPSFPLW